MSDILKRTIFMDDSGGLVRFHDWAVVTHALGTMMEPFIGIQRYERNTLGGCIPFDATDGMCRIDRIERLSLDKGFQIMPDPSGMNLHGGNLMPRTGR
jgi:hypothetical protein